MQYRESLSKAIYGQLRNDTALTNQLGTYTVSETEYAAIYSGQVPEDKREYPYIVIYAPLTPGPSERAKGPNGPVEVSRKPTFQINVYHNERLKQSKVQQIMDLIDDALSTIFTREGLRLRPRFMTNGTPSWEEDASHWWVWMRFQCTVTNSET